MYPNTVDPGTLGSGMHAVLSVPMLRDRALIGAITVDPHEVRPFSETETA